MLVDENPNFSRNSFNWIINSMVKNGSLTKLQRGMYAVLADGTEKQPYQPVFREKTAELIGQLEKRFSLIEFTCFESIQLNEFLNHLIAQNGISIEQMLVDIVAEKTMQLHLLTYCRYQYTIKLTEIHFGEIDFG